MQDTELLKYGRFITSLISSVVTNTAPPSPFEGIDWNELFKLAKKHDVAVMIYPAVCKMDIPADAMELFKKDRNRMVARTTRQAIEADKIFHALEENNIKYIRLKGIHIKEFYPAPYMRIFSDVDFYVSKEDREKSKPIMESLGYELVHPEGYHDEYEKDNFYIYEIHNPLVSDEHNYSDIFSDPFTKAVATDKNNMNFVLNNEYFYLHLFFHLYQHFITRGCGIRLFTDLLVFEHNVKNVDFDFIKSVLKQHNMLDFYNSTQKLLEFFFFDGIADDDITKVATFIFKCRANEDFSNHLANLGFFGKIKYFLKIWFPPAKELAFRYPVLEKAPILLPVCWLRRIFYSLFFNRSAVKKQTENVKHVSSTEFKEIKTARQLATKTDRRQ